MTPGVGRPVSSVYSRAFLMCPARRLMLFFSQWFGVVWVGCFPHACFAPAADNGHFTENNDYFLE